jgi:hypothetical protein
MSGNGMARTVKLASTRDGWGRELVASLPRSLRRVDDPMADIVLIDGAGDWTATATQALAQDARTMVVVEPGPVDQAALAMLAYAVATAGANVAMVAALADNPALDGFRSLIDDAFGELVLDGGQGNNLAGVLLLQLHLLRAAGTEDLRLTTLAVSSVAFIIEGEGRIGAVVRRVRLTGAVGMGPARINVAAYAAAATARLSWRGDAVARPVEVTLADAAGLRTLPPIHESGQRNALRTLLASPGAGRGSAVLRTFGLDLVQLQELLGAP